jgi:threonine dehydrogenase-like Zn-dependent dehydrogenase
VKACKACSEGNYGSCSNLDKGIIPPGLFTGLCKDLGGGWGEFVVAHKSRIFKLPNSITYEEAVIIEPLSCSIHAVLKKLPKDNEICVVVGCGTIGLTTILTLKALTNNRVIAVAKYPYQSEIAEKVGADQVILAKRDTHIKKIGREIACKILSPPGEDALLAGGGADVVIDSLGNASSLSNSIRIINHQGTIILVGVPANAEIDWTPFIYKEAQIIPSWVYGYDEVNGHKQRTFQIAIDLISSGSVNVKNILTQTFTIDQYRKGLMIAANKRENDVIKAAFKFE